MVRDKRELRVGIFIFLIDGTLVGAIISLLFPVNIALIIGCFAWVIFIIWAFLDWYYNNRNARETKRFIVEDITNDDDVGEEINHFYSNFSLQLDNLPILIMNADDIWIYQIKLLPKIPSIEKNNKIEWNDNIYLILPCNWENAFNFFERTAPYNGYHFKCPLVTKLQWKNIGEDFIRVKYKLDKFPVLLVTSCSYITETIQEKILSKI